MDTIAPLDWEQVTATVVAWPLDRRILLMHRLLNMVAADIRAGGKEAHTAGASSNVADQHTVAPHRDSALVGPDPRLYRTQDELEEIMARAIESLRTDRPPPDDDEVRRILDEARREKYG